MSIDLSKKNILQNFFALASSSLFSQGLAFFVLILVARVLGSQSYGAYISCFSLTRLTSVFFNWGLDVWLLRQGGASNELTRESIGNSLLLKSFLGATWVLMFLTASLFIQSPSYPADLLRVVAVTTWFEGLLMTVFSGYKAILRNQRTAFLSTISSLCILLVTILLTTVTTSATIYAEARGIILFITFTFGLWWLYREVKFTFNFSRLRKLFREALPFMLSDGLVAIYTSADIIIITMMLGKDMAGLYAPVSTLAAAVFIIPQSIFVVVLPIISNQVQEQKPTLFPFVRKTWVIFTLVGGGLWLGLALFSLPIVALLLGPGYFASSDVLRILSTILFFKSGSFAMVGLLIAANRQRYRLFVQAIVAALNVILNILIIRSFGINGVAWVYVISEALLLVGYLIGVSAWQREYRSKAQPIL